jgi:hypothetical protein
MINSQNVAKKCYDKNLCVGNQSYWQYLMQKHNCTKLVAACICFIELEDDK